MKKILLLSVLFFSVFQPVLLAAEKMKVVAAHRILEDWVREIGQEHVAVSSLHDGRRNVHFFEPRPSHIKQVASADALVIAGLDLDPWMTELIAASRNSKVQYGAIGLIDPSIDIFVLEKPEGTINMSQGDVHPYGNPHFYFYKENVLKAIENITDGLSKVRPELTEVFKKNAEVYSARVSKTFERLNAALQPYKGLKIVTYHKSWDYFAAQFGLQIIGALEPKPGIPPSPSHLAKLVETMNQEKVSLIVAENFFSDGPIESVASRTRAVPLRLANLLGERKEDATYLDLLENNVNELIRTLSEQKQKK